MTRPKDAELAARVHDRGYWSRLHVRSDRSPAVQLGRLMRRVTLGHGVRLERGGFRPEKRP